MQKPFESNKRFEGKGDPHFFLSATRKGKGRGRKKGHSQGNDRKKRESRIRKTQPLFFNKQNAQRALSAMARYYATRKGFVNVFEVEQRLHFLPNDFHK